MGQKTCVASELVSALQAMIEQHGDMPVYTADPDTDRRLPIGLVFASADQAEELPARFEITSDYYVRPDGDLA